MTGRFQLPDAAADEPPAPIQMIHHPADTRAERGMTGSFDAPRRWMFMQAVGPIIGRSGDPEDRRLAEPYFPGAGIPV